MKLKKKKKLLTKKKLINYCWHNRFHISTFLIIGSSSKEIRLWIRLRLCQYGWTWFTAWVCNFCTIKRLNLRSTYILNYIGNQFLGQNSLMWVERVRRKKLDIVLVVDWDRLLKVRLIRPNLQYLINMQLESRPPTSHRY